MAQFEFLPEYQDAIDSIKKNPVTFLSGNAGSGKSTFIRYVRSKLPKSVLVAPTGIAAINVKGVTIHSMFRLPPKFILPEDVKHLPIDKRTILRECPLLIIDEVSMVSSNLLDAIDESLQKNLNSDKPFGGLHVLLVGDLFQLPPIVGSNVEEIYNEFYDGPMFFDSLAMRQLYDTNGFGFVSLKRVMRQRGDDTFIQILNCIRTGDDINDAIELLNSKVKMAYRAPPGYVQITPYNEVSDLTNQRNLDALETKIKTYYGVVSGKYNQKNIPVPLELSLKVGAQVMITRNMSQSVVNGTIGKIVQLNTDYIVVDVDGEEHKVEKTRWEEYGYEKIDGKYKSIVVGSYLQFPIKLAWSMTIHKVQSATINKLYIDMDKGAFAPGMLYVALSRAVSLDGLVISKPIEVSDVMIDDRTVDFYKQFEE